MALLPHKNGDSKMTQSELEQFEMNMINEFKDSQPFNLEVHSEEEIVLTGVFSIHELQRLAIAILKEVESP